MAKVIAKNTKRETKEQPFMSPKGAVMICGHGSRDERAVSQFNAMVETMKQTPYGEVKKQPPYGEARKQSLRMKLGNSPLRVKLRSSPL